MTDTLPAQPPPRRRLLRFLIPVLLAHGLLLASLPYWPSGSPPVHPGVSVLLAPIAADSDQPPSPTPAAAPSESPPAATIPPPLPEPITPPPVAVLEPTRPAAPVSAKPPAAETEQPSPATSRTPPVAAVGSATPAGSKDSAPDWRDAYQVALRDALAALHHYPPRARRFGLSGEVLVAFSIERDGRFSDIRLARSSNADLLDQAAQDTVRHLGRFQPLPADYSEDSWAVSVPLVYRLD